LITRTGALVVEWRGIREIDAGFALQPPDLLTHGQLADVICPGNCFDLTTSLEKVIDPGTIDV